MDILAFITALIEIFSNCNAKSAAEVRQLKAERRIIYSWGVMRAARQAAPDAKYSDVRKYAEEGRAAIDKASDDDLEAFCRMCAEHRGN